MNSLIITTNLMARLHLIAALSAAFTVAGCGGIPINEVKAALSAVKPCCVGYDSVQFAALTIGSRSKFTLSTASQAMPTSEGLAYFAAYRLPQGGTQLEVQALNTEYLPKSTYPDPLLLVLDASYKVISEIKDLPLRQGRHTIFPGIFENHYKAIVTLPANSHYILVFGRPNSDRNQSATSDNGSLWTVPSAPVGTLALIPI